MVNSEHPTRLEGKYAAIVVCWLLGNGCLFSWNSMLTIEDYYIYLFPKYHPPRVLTLVYQPFAVGTLAVLAYNEAKINTRIRNLFGYTLFFIATLLVLILDLATSGKGGLGTFIGICAISGAFGVADAHVQGGMVGDLSYMRPEFIQSFLAGLAASGVLTSALRLITKAAFENSKDGLRKGAILFFAISTFFELLCVLLYAFVFPKLPIVKYYRSKAASEGSKTVSADLAAGGIQTIPGGGEEYSKEPERKGNKQLLWENIDYALDMFLIYVLTLSIFPGFLSEDTGSHSLGSCIYFTAKYGDQGWMIFLTSFLGLSNGYLTVCVLTSAPKGYKGPEQNALGNLLVLFLLGGIFAGVTLDWLWLIVQLDEQTIAPSSRWSSFLHGGLSSRHCCFVTMAPFSHRATITVAFVHSIMIFLCAAERGKWNRRGKRHISQENDKNVVTRLGVTKRTVVKPCSGKDGENDAVKEEELGLLLK
ncbi:Equilibrative nucleoside transporter [Sesbania bispinosa]|nr:Equilibrative nucleoside transporter [Sesbania bispinosa]